MTKGRADLPWRENQDLSRLGIRNYVAQTQVNGHSVFQSVHDHVSNAEWFGSSTWTRFAKSLGRSWLFTCSEYAKSGHSSAWRLQAFGRIQWLNLENLTHWAIRPPSLAFQGTSSSHRRNAFRVCSSFQDWCRYRATEDTQGVFDLGLQLIDPERPGDFNQAIMDLGSSLIWVPRIMT